MGARKSHILRLYEDNHLLVVVKPPDIPVQKDRTRDMDLLTLLKEDIRERFQKPGNVYLGMVHRLDRPVGGVMVFARTSKAAARLSEQIRSRTVEKEYLAVISGCMDPSEGRLEGWIYKDERTNTSRMASPETPGARQVCLDYRMEAAVSRKEGAFGLVRIGLETGRSHQIRVQFSSAGHPLWGDVRYKTAMPLSGPADRSVSGIRPALWAVRLKFRHPVTGKELVFEAGPPMKLPWSWFDRNAVLACKQPPVL
ncbi:MAG TPA: RNA pseudouridine synthase [Clostridiales bacterium]|nr:RNA pseudouridine synthase [Clostridiales bacterium]